MKNKYPVKGKIIYLVSLTLRSESVNFGSGCGGLGALEQHLPDLFVHSVEEPIQSLVLRRIKLPHMDSPALADENPAKQHHLDYIDKLDILGHHALDTCLQRYQLIR